MPNTYFRFKKFTVEQAQSAMKVTTDGCLFGAWCAHELRSLLLKQQRLLDVGTGTGLLSLMVAQKNEVLIDAVEIDKAAAAEALANIEASPWASSIKIHNEDILNWQGEYDVIVSNPPFYENSLLSDAAAENVAHHSTLLTLQQLMETIEARLSGWGKFLLLLPYHRLGEFRAIASVMNFRIDKIVMVKQTVTHSPFRVMLSGSRDTGKAANELVLSVKNSEDRYTPQFVELLKDYYLNL